MRFIKITAARDEAGHDLERDEDPQSRLVGFGPGYVVELRQRPPLKSSDRLLTWMEVHDGGVGHTVHYDVLDVTPAQLAAKIEAATEPATPAPAKDATANLSRWPLPTVG